MENTRALILKSLILLAGIMSPFFAWAYETNTHEALARATVEAYGQLHSGTFVSMFDREIVRGSSGEDFGSRPTNHFYDPVNNRGLTVWRGEFESSKQWARDTEAQGNYNCWGTIICFGTHVGYNDKWFSSPTDYSWDRAVYEYVYGDKARAAETLGHILHLLQDATVPAHVRNDPHLNHNGYGDADPYENFTGQFSQVAVPNNLQTPNFIGLSEAFDFTAEFTNKNFLSKDTLFKNYSSPILDSLDIKNGFVYSRFGHKVARAEVRINKKAGEFIKEIEIKFDDENDSVASDYWRVLSKRAIESGVGVIDLFFKEAEKERQAGKLKAKNVSQAELDFKETASKSFKVVKKLYGSSLNQEEYDELLGASVATAPALEPEPTPVTVPPQIARDTAPQKIEEPGIVAGEESEAPQTPLEESPASATPEVEETSIEPIPNPTPFPEMTPPPPEPPPPPQSSPSTGGALHVPPPPAQEEQAAVAAEEEATSTPDTATSTPEVATSTQETATATSTSQTDAAATSTATSTDPSSQATSTPALTTEFHDAPFEDSFDNFNSLGWSEINTRYATTSENCYSNACIKAQTGFNVIAKTGTPVLEGGFTIRGRRHIGFRTVIPDMFISYGPSENGEYVHILDDIPDDDAWHQYAIFLREGPAGLKEFCLLTDRTDPVSCSWFSTKVNDNIQNGIPIDTIRLDANVSRTDLGDAVWWDELRRL